MRLDKKASKAIKVLNSLFEKRQAMPIETMMLVGEGSIQRSGRSRFCLDRIHARLLVSIKTNKSFCSPIVEHDEYQSCKGKVIHSDGEMVSCEAQDFPPFSILNQDNVGVSFPSEVWESLKTISLACEEYDISTRLNLRSVRIEEGRKGQFTAVGTDGHRLAYADLNLPGLFAADIPAGLIQLLKDADNVRLIRMGGGKFYKLTCWIYDYALEVTYSAADCPFPEWRQVLPKRSGQKVRVLHVPELVDSLNRCIKALPSSKKTPIVKVSLNGCLTLNTRDPQFGACTYTLPMSHDGPDMELNLNARYLLEAITTKKLAVNLRVSGPLEPVMLQQSDVNWLIMPCRDM